MRPTRTAFAALAAGVLLAVPTGTSAQDPVPVDPGAEQLVDRVAAVVGDSAILMSEIEQGLVIAEAQGWRRPTDPAALRQAQMQILDRLVNEQLLLQEAAQDTTLVLDPQALEDAVDQEVDAQIQRVGTRRIFEQQLAQNGYTIASYREDRREFFRRQMLRERYLAKRAADPSLVEVSDEEIRTFYDENRALMPQLPAMVEFVNYRLAPQPSDSARAAALAQAREVLMEARRDDADFDALARRHSMGPSRAEGGMLGWMREDGSYDPDFEDAVFMLPPGIVSEPVETQFGYHLILVERVRGGERRVRHILFTPTVTEADVQANEDRAQALRATLAEGGTPESLEGVQVDTLTVPQNQLGNISNFYARAMAETSPGEILGPMPMNDPSSESTLGVARVLDVQEGGPASLEDMRPQIEARLQDEKLQERVVAQLRDSAYIDNRLAADSGG